MSVNINEIVMTMQNFWIAKQELMQSYENGSSKKRKFQDFAIQRIALHLTHYVLNSNNSAILFSQERFRLESLLALRKWSQLSQFCNSIRESSFKFLDNEEKENFLLNGLCTAFVIDHFSHFFGKGSFFNNPFQLQQICNLELDGKTQFYSFLLDKEILKTQSTNLRFLQAAYKVSSAFNYKKSSGYLSSSILGKYGLKLTRRFPELKLEENGRQFFYIEELIPQLKKCENYDKAYLLGISDFFNPHAIGVYTAQPYHFIDPSFGIGVAESFDELLLFLANYITEKYPKHETFAILEFDKLPPKKDSFEE